MRESYMKPGHIKHFEYEEKLHEAMDTLNNLSMKKSYMKPGHIKHLEYEEKLHEARPH